MNNVQQLHILYWQAAAALLMGADYFLPRRVIEYVEEYMRPGFRVLHKNVSTAADGAFATLWTHRRKLVWSLICVGALFLVNWLLKIFGPFSMQPIVVLPVMLAYVVLMCGTAPLIVLIVTFFIQGSLGNAASVVLKFVNESPRGLVAAMGMLCLLWSFALRYMNLT